MKDIAFPVRNSTRQKIKLRSDQQGIEILTSATLNLASVILLDEIDFYGEKKNHYFVSQEASSLDTILREAGISGFVSSALNSAMKPSYGINRFERPLIMAAVNATPDSFYPGSRLGNGNRLLDDIIDAKPDIIDVGGESTRPGSMEISTVEEIERISPVIEYISSSTDIPISLDTRHPDVLSRFAEVIEYANDISGFRNDRMISISSDFKLKCITMHMRGEPANMQKMTKYTDLIPEVLSFLLESAERLTYGGIPGGNIILDPGIGFSKDFYGNLEILREIGSFSVGYRTLIGASRKSFIGTITGEETQGRLPGTLSTTAYLALSGVDILRVHDPEENLQAVKVLDSILNYGV